MSVNLDFEFFVTGLEDSILNRLEKGDDERSQNGMTGIKEFASYSGELEREDVIDALKREIRRFPLALVSYGSGTDKRKASTNLLFDEPIELEHRCGFVVICATNDVRSEKARRRGKIYKMISQAQQLLGGVQFEVEVESEKVMLNTEPFLPVAVEAVTRLPDLTAYAVHFETAFHYWLPDRRVVAGNVEEIGLNIEPTRQPENNFGGEHLPGVHRRIQG